ncbi:MobA/MobL family protein, partial [Staphylococcus aureus]
MPHGKPFSPLSEKTLSVSGIIADVAFHHMYKTNPHAHIMLTTRAVGPAGFGGKVRDWNDRTH